MTERIVLATVPSESGRAVLNLGGLPDRARSFVATQANVVIAVSVPVLILSMAVMVWSGRANVDASAGLDYQVYRWAVNTWLSGGDIMNDAPMTSIGQVLPWVYPPFALLILLPLSVVPFIFGLVVLFGINLATIGTVIYLVVRRMWPSVGKHGALATAAALLPLTLFLEPVYASFGLGQVNIMLMGLVAADCLAPNPRWPRGLLVGIAAATKLTPAAFLLFFLVRKDFRAAVTVVVTAGACTAVGFLINFPASLDYWFLHGPASGVGGSTFHTNQSIMGGLARLELAGPVQTGIWILLAAVLTLVTIRILRRVEASLALAANGLLALLVSPTSWSDHWVWIVPGVLLMYGYAVSRRSIGWLVAAVVTSVAAMVASFRLLPTREPQGWTPVQHLLGDSYLLLGLALLLLLGRDALRRDSEEQAGMFTELDTLAMARPLR